MFEACELRVHNSPQTKQRELDRRWKAGGCAYIFANSLWLCHCQVILLVTVRII